jgi:uncharacterized membrane protein YkoI
MRIANVFASVVFGAIAATVVVTAQETKVKKKDLPAAVQQAMEREVQGATVKGFAKEIEGGKTFYEVETIKAGHSRDILFDPNGQVVEVEEEVALDTLPAAVKDALSAAGKVTKVESVTKGQTVVYEGHIVKAGKRSEVKVTADGKAVP